MDSEAKPELDAEQIHNLIDMAMSETYDLVSSWLPTPTPAAAARDAEIAAENASFEQMAFRPPRLGLGAPLPTNRSRQDDFKLRKTLAGKAVASERSTDLKGKGRALLNVEPGSSDEDSKSRIVSTKAPIHDALMLFEDAKSKKRKKGNNKAEPIVKPLLEDLAEEWHGIQYDRGSPSPLPTPGDFTAKFGSSRINQIPHLLSIPSIISDSSTLGESLRSSPTTTLSPPSSLSSLRKASQDPSLERSGSPSHKHEVPDISPHKNKKRKRSKILHNTQ